MMSLILYAYQPVQVERLNGVNFISLLCYKHNMEPKWGSYHDEVIRRYESKKAEGTVKTIRIVSKN
ncbi:MAG: hypothetical protein COW26_03095 [Nitrosopumilales archaeon CG15_BIG_FIL_POST_REV_8_21_14_020_33_23]|nr:MAG: hypothetical protein COW26_03095 [Nitrosopumilales archaeon CG15_BIG_FIL_POST_REV_8_21_14_020_33_23]